MQIQGNYGVSMPYRMGVEQNASYQNQAAMPAAQMNESQSIMQQMMGLVTMLVQTVVGLVQGIMQGQQGRMQQQGGSSGGSSGLGGILNIGKELLSGLFGGNSASKGESSKSDSGFSLGGLLDIGGSLLGGAGGLLKGGWNMIKDFGGSILKGITSLF